MMTAGAILMEKHAACPQCFHLKDSSPTDWMAVTHNLSPHELEKELSAAGWIFFHMAIAIRTTAFGFNRAKMIHAALKRLVANVRLQGCNALKSTTWRPLVLGPAVCERIRPPAPYSKGRGVSGQ
jgi:hypothetical protein